MSKRKKVIWKEGMFLQPQHFQLSDRNSQRLAADQMLLSQPYFFGVSSCTVDSAALANGTFALTACSGVFPDGTFFSIPREDDPPQPRSFADRLSHEQQECDVHLSLPLVMDNRPNAAPAEGLAAQCRYRVQSITVPDEVTGSQQKQIDAGSYNLGIVFGGESLDNCTSLRIARLKRNPSGRFEVQEDFIPPLARIGGSGFLLGRMRSLLEMLLAKSSALSAGRKEAAGGKATFSSAEETAFRLLETINTHTPLLNHYHVEPQVHPFDLFRLLTQFAGALTAFSSDVSLKDLPRYDHHNLSGTFEGLFRLIRTVLEADIDAACVQIPLDQVNAATWVCKPPSGRILTESRLFLGVSARVGEKELIIGVAQRIKMSSRDRLDLLISSAMPGLPLIHVAHPPEGLSTKPGFLYFALDQQSQFWRTIQTAGSIAFYFPNNYPELKLEMLALRQ